MNTHQLRAFVAVCEHMSFTKAARELYLTQSAVSQQIQALEVDLGLRLFVRSGHTVKLTPEGVRFREDIGPIMHMYDRAIANARAAGKDESLTLTIGSGISYADYWLPRAIERFERGQHGINVSVVHDETYNLPSLLQKGSVDAIAILESDIHDLPGFGFIPLARSKCLIFVHPDNPLADLECVTPDDLAKQRVILMSSKTSSRRLHFLFRVLAKQGVHWDDYVLADCGETALMMAASGQGAFPGLEMEYEYAKHLGLVGLPLGGLDVPHVRVGVAYLDRSKRMPLTAFSKVARIAIGELACSEGGPWRSAAKKSERDHGWNA